VLQARDWHITIICASTDKNHCASSLLRAVRPVAKIFCEHSGLIRLKVRLVHEANINPVFTKELLQFQLPATNYISVPTSWP
jgi:hypothetical protein